MILSLMILDNTIYIYEMLISLCDYGYSVKRHYIINA